MGGFYTIDLYTFVVGFNGFEGVLSDLKGVVSLHHCKVSLLADCNSIIVEQLCFICLNCLGHFMLNLKSICSGLLSTIGCSICVLSS